MNVVEVAAFNADGYLSSRGMVRRFRGPGLVAPPPRLYAVVAGVSKYRGRGIDLHYAAKDAEDFAAALGLAATRMLDADHVHITLLSTDQHKPENQPTRDNLVKALSELKNTRPGDIVVVYLAGHGVNHGGQEGDFFFLGSEARSDSLEDPAARQRALSSKQLTDLLMQALRAKKC